MTGSAEVLVVGAGPTGLTLAAQLAAHGVRPRIIDRRLDRVHESRALAIQPRTLEVLAGLGVTDRLVAAGNRNVDLRLHTRGRVVSAPLFNLAAADTAYPYLLFLSQAETERMLSEHLTGTGIPVERGVELVSLAQDSTAVTTTLRHEGGRDETFPTSYVVGCDGALSTVRTLAGIGFEGGTYPQTFILADLEADGVAPGAAHVYLSDAGMLFFFPLLTPATWRLLAMRPPHDPTPPDAPATLAEIQALVDAFTDGTVRLRDPVWMTNFRLHHRAATAYRAGRVFLAGDAAHIHSPAGGQGMNTGIQDAVNLAWKLAHTVHGSAGAGLLDTYHTERAPIGAAVLAFTGRAFTIATAINPLVRFARTRLAPGLIPLVLGPKTARRYAFRTVTQLAIRYRSSPLSVNGPHPPRRGPKAGDRLPDAPLIHNGQETSLHTLTRSPGWHLLLCGPHDAWPDRTPAPSETLTVHHLSAHTSAAGLHDPSGTALSHFGLGPTDTAQYLVRPDGHIGYRSSGPDLTSLHAYVRRWLPSALAHT
jgi:2-polyprenyl-6-methoxyphenol hydroxylase-like FAD-dependent oxidoreductase